MFNNSDRIAPLLPFILALLAGLMGIKSNVDLFSWLHQASFSEISNTTEHIVLGDR